jgi:LAO/AO transport system kinase
MRALYDRVIVETVGVGQSETDIATVADTIVLCVQPGSGDSLQYIKAGIAEIPDVTVVGKADLGGIAIKAQRDLEAALALERRADRWTVPVVPVSGSSGQGIAELIRAIADHARHLGGGRLEGRRLAQAHDWLADSLCNEVGRRGLERAKRAGALNLAPGEAPFSALARLLAALELPAR